MRCFGQVRCGGEERELPRLAGGTLLDSTMRCSELPRDSLPGLWGATGGHAPSDRYAVGWGPVGAVALVHCWTGTMRCGAAGQVRCGGEERELPRLAGGTLLDRYDTVLLDRYDAVLSIAAGQSAGLVGGDSGDKGGVRRRIGMRWGGDRLEGGARALVDRYDAAVRCGAVLLDRYDANGGCSDGYLSPVHCWTGTMRWGGARAASAGGREVSRAVKTKKPGGRGVCRACGGEAGRWGRPRGGVVFAGGYGTMNSVRAKRPAATVTFLD
jgi:hypothetical protein